MSLSRPRGRVLSCWGGAAAGGLDGNCLMEITRVSFHDPSNGTSHTLRALGGIFVGARSCTGQDTDVAGPRLTFALNDDSKVAGRHDGTRGRVPATVPLAHVHNLIPPPRARRRSSSGSDRHAPLHESQACGSRERGSLRGSRSRGRQSEPLPGSPAL